MSILITNPIIVTMNDNYDIYDDGYVYIEGDRISKVGNNPLEAELLKKTADTVIPADDKILLPGLVNAHTHMFQTFMRGLGDDKPLLTWLKEEIWPFSSMMSQEDFYYSALIACLENLKSGATSVIDQHYVHTSPNNSDAVFNAMVESGIRGVYCRCFANIEYYPNLCETDDTIKHELQRLYDTWHGTQKKRLSVSVGPINPWGVTPEMLVWSKEFAVKNGLKYQVHTAETKAVVEKTIEKYGKRNVEFFNDLGIIDENTQLVHSVWYSDEELSIVKDKKAVVVHCPVANMYLASGVARVPEMLEQGTKVALATDGPGSNNSQDMLSVLKHTACLHKVNTLNAQVLYPKDVLTMATRSGATAIGRDDIGVIKEGMKADIILVDWKKPHIAPMHKADSALCYNANGNDVDTVIVDGEVVIKNKKSPKIDEAALIEECQSRINFIRKKVKG